MTMSVRLAETGFAAESELAAFCSTLEDDGAVVSFVGIARRETLSGEPVERLFLEAHPRLTLPSIEAIGEAAHARFELSALHIVHRFGAIMPGEPIVFVAAASVHRRPAFEAADYMMDRLKSDALFWKREDSPSGSKWIEPRDDDRSALERWRGPCPE